MPTERVVLEQYVRQAERQVATGERSIARQRQLVQQLEREGRDATEACELLQQFEKLQQAYLTDRDRLRDLLESSEQG